MNQKSAQEAVKLLEPGSCSDWTFELAFEMSIAISLKRIADLLEKGISFDLAWPQGEK